VDKTLVVKKDADECMQMPGLPIILRDPIFVKLRDQSLVNPGFVGQTGK